MEFQKLTPLKKKLSFTESFYGVVLTLPQAGGVSGIFIGPCDLS